MQSIQMKSCTDHVIGDILSSWRYDISGINPEMARDYEQHLAECTHCRSRQRLHRIVDVALLGLSTLSIAVFLLAFAVIHRLQPTHHWQLVEHVGRMSVVLTLQAAAIAGLLVSLFIWVLAAVATPAPNYLTGVALAQARVLQDRIPEELEELKERLTRTA
jgi:hypothetical protein